MRAKLTLNGLLLLALLSGCVSVESNVDRSFKKEIERVFVYVQGSEKDARFMNDLGRALSESLAARGITSTSYVEDALSLEGAAGLNERVSEYAPDVVLIVVQTEKVLINGASSAGVFEAGMFEPGSDAYVWKARVESDTGGFAGVGLSGQVAARIVAQMEKDGLVRPKSDSGATAVR